MSQHLSTEERIKIETLLDLGTSKAKIASYLGRHRSTIYRELNRPGIFVISNMMQTRTISKHAKIWVAS